MKNETLKITWKRIIRKGYGRTPITYGKYVAENNNHHHKLRISEGTELFDILCKTIISKHTERYEKKVVVEGVYYNNVLVKIINPRIL